MKKGQYHEPWIRNREVLEDTPRITSDVNHICYMNDEKETHTMNDNEPNWCDYGDRIVSCVNALDGLNPDKLQALIEAVENMISNENIVTLDHGEGDFEAYEVEYEDFNKVKSALDALKGE